MPTPPGLALALCLGFCQRVCAACLFCMCLSGSLGCEPLTFVWSSCYYFSDSAKKWPFDGLQYSHPCSLKSFVTFCLETVISDGLGAAQDVSWSMCEMLEAVDGIAQAVGCSVASALAAVTPAAIWLVPLIWSGLRVLTLASWTWILL